MKADDEGPNGRDLSKALGLDAERLAERLAFYEISGRDEELLAQISDVCDPRLDDVIADFYAHLLRFPQLEELLRAAPDYQLAGGHERYVSNWARAWRTLPIHRS